jgi:RNA polymerase sigma factor (sigma-70 family)
MENQIREWSPGNLLAGVSGGDRAAWAEIIRRYGPLLLHVAARMGLSRSDAADVAQLTWIRLWQHGHQIRESERLGGWLVSTARREAIRVATASSRYVLSADPSAERVRSNPESLHDVYQFDREYDGIVELALRRLPARYRTLLRLLSSDLELSYSEIADRLGVPIGSIGPMRMRAIRMIENTPEFISGRFPRPAAAAADSYPHAQQAAGG